MLVIKKRFPYTTLPLYITVGVIAFISTIAILRATHMANADDTITYSNTQPRQAESSLDKPDSSTTPPPASHTTPDQKNAATTPMQPQPVRSTSEQPVTVSSSDAESTVSVPQPSPVTPLEQETPSKDSNDPSLLGLLLKPVGGILDILL